MLRATGAASGRSKRTPRVVYLLLTYNHACFVVDAVRSALAQDHPSLEILISDDASNDETFGIIERTVADYSGPHSVRLNRNAARLGSIEHLASLAELLGDDAFIVTAHGDDMSDPARTRRLVQTWRDERVAMVSSDVRWLEGDTVRERPERPSRRIAAADMIEGDWLPEMLGATLAFESRVLSAFERLDARKIACGLDHILPLRAAALGGFFFLGEQLVTYRRHADNMSNTITDRTGSSDILDEGLLSYELAIRQQQRKDLLLLARRRRASPRHWLLLRQLERRLINDVARWAELRARLRRRDLMATWCPVADVAKRKIVWEARV